MGKLADLRAQAHATREAQRAAAARMPIVVTYKDAKAFEHDSRARFAAGWTVSTQSQSAGRITATRVVGLGVVGLFAKKGRGITVTWMPPVSAP